MIENDEDMNIRTIRTLLYATVIGAVVLPFESEAAPLMSAAGGRPGRDDYVKSWGVRVQDFARNFGSDGEIAVEQIESNVSCNMAYPGENVQLVVQVRNLTDKPLEFNARWVRIDQSLQTRSEDVFDLGIVVRDSVRSEPIAVKLEGRGVAHITVAPDLPEVFGSSVVLLEREDTGTRLFVGSLARIVEADLPSGQQDYQVCMDLAEPEAISRLRTAPNRIGVPFFPEEDPGCERVYREIANQLKGIGKTGFPVCVEFGAGSDRGNYLPLGRTRPHLTEDDILMETKSDFAWLPAYDAEFKERVKWIVKEFGYPRGPVNSLMLWNEPWNGLSISGWGADDLRYREIYTVMCEAADEVMAENPDIKVLLGGCDSSSNTFDKLFPDDDMKFLKWLDFMSIHYQGLSPSNPKFLRDREHPNGRVRFWDTESWVANSEDRVPGVLAGMLAAGHDRLVGIQGNAVVANGYNVDAVLDDGTRERRRQFNAWPVAPALAAFQHLVGNRKFGGLLWEGLPWIYKFEGNGSDDLTLVICGDISVAFDGKGRTGIVPFRTARGDKPVDGKLTIAGAQDFQLFDGNGNKISFDNNEIIVSLNDKGFYLRSDGTPGSGARLLEAVKKAKVDGYLPVAPAFRDSVKRIEDGAVFYVDLKNVLNRELSGTLVVEADGLELEYEKAVSINANGVISIPLKVISGSSSAENAYRFKMQFDALDDGVVEFEEVLHCNVISSLTPRLDGSLDDWQDALPQMVAAGGSGATMMEKAWLPMLNHETGVADGMAVAWLAADDDNFYFAARISDSTPDPGMPRFETWDEDAYFYPEEVTQYNASETTSMKLSSTRVKTGGTGAVWSSLVNKVAFTITPPDGGARLAIRFADDDNMYRRNMRLTVKNLSTGEKLSEHGVKAEMEHAWFRLNINTAVRVEVETLNWLKPQIVAVALDPVEADLKSAEMETGSGDEFSGNYGTLALFTPDGNDAASSASEYKLEWIDEISAITLKWPDGIRRYSYRMRPDLPQGATPAHDNVQIAFNVLPDDLKPWYPMAPGTFKGYAGYWDTDYEFALNPVAEKFGGGVEIWKLRAPYLPDKHYYPRSPKHPLEGPVKNGSLVIKRDGQFRIVEAAIPWNEIPEVKEARDKGQPIKFSYRVNDNGAPGVCMELAYMRSISKRNESFKPGWAEHWANELEFGWSR